VCQMRIFFEANLTRSSLAGITAHRTVFYKATLKRTKLQRSAEKG
jgi:uncharacterized protein YjbI with pentapeptide repeats